MLLQKSGRVEDTLPTVNFYPYIKFKVNISLSSCATKTSVDWCCRPAFSKKLMNSSKACGFLTRGMSAENKESFLIANWSLLNELFSSVMWVTVCKEILLFYKIIEVIQLVNTNWSFFPSLMESQLWTDHYRLVDARRRRHRHKHNH